MKSAIMVKKKKAGFGTELKLCREMTEGEKTNTYLREEDKRVLPLRLSSLVGTQIFWILFWVSSLGIPLRAG